MLSEESKQKLLCLADWIEQKVPAREFNMNYWSFHDSKYLVEGQEPSCGTQCCIAGWAVLGAGHRMREDGSTYDKANNFLGAAKHVAADLLGLDAMEETRLFMPSQWPGADRGAFTVFPNTPKGAADRIRYFVKTGI